MTTVSSRRYYPGHNYCIQCSVPGQDYCSIRFLKHRDTGAAPWVASHSHAFLIISLKEELGLG